MGRYDLATGKKPTPPTPEELHKQELEANKPVNIDEGVPTTSERNQRNIVFSNRGPLSKNFTLSGPNGFEVSISLNRLNIKPGIEDVYNDEKQLVITLPKATAQSILDDIAAARRVS